MSLIPKTDLGAGVSLKSKDDLPLGTTKHGEFSQASRALALGSYFLSGAMAINASQVLGAPLFLINKEWYNAWIAFTKQSFGLLTMTMTQWWAPTVVKVSGDRSMRGQLMKTTQGNLFCAFPQRLVLIANHQIYTDWLYLWWIAYTNGMHGRLYILLKESLRHIPVLGWGMQLSQFIFLKRDWEKDKPNMQKALERLNKPTDPMWLMLFPEGTNLAACTREKSKRWAEKNGMRDMQHQLLPRSTGLQFCLQELRQTVNYVYDCTIAYDGVPRGQFAQDIYTIKSSYLEGRPPKIVHIYWRCFAISSIPIDNDKAFERWLTARWREKDDLLEGWYRTGQFPADTGAEKTPDGKTRRGCGHILTQIRPSQWYEFLQIFAPMGVLALVLYVFYGALPQKFLRSINKQALLTNPEELTKLQINGLEKSFPWSAILNNNGQPNSFVNTARALGRWIAMPNENHLLATDPKAGQGNTLGIRKNFLEELQEEEVRRQKQRSTSGRKYSTASTGTFWEDLKAEEAQRRSAVNSPKSLRSTTSKPTIVPIPSQKPIQETPSIVSTTRRSSVVSRPSLSYTTRTTVPKLGPPKSAVGTPLKPSGPLTRSKSNGDTEKAKTQKLVTLKAVTTSTRTKASPQAKARPGANPPKSSAKPKLGKAIPKQNTAKSTPPKLKKKTIATPAIESHPLISASKNAAPKAALPIAKQSQTKAEKPLGIQKKPAAAPTAPIRRKPPKLNSVMSPSVKKEGLIKPADKVRD